MEALRSRAWAEVLATQAGKIVVTDILVRGSHLVPTSDHDTRVRQQFVLELMTASGLIDSKSGSFPFDYVSTLTGIKLQKPAVSTPEPKKPNLLGRLLGRNA